MLFPLFGISQTVIDPRPDDKVTQVWTTPNTYIKVYDDGWVKPIINYSHLVIKTDEGKIVKEILGYKSKEDEGWESLFKGQWRTHVIFSDTITILSEKTIMDLKSGNKRGFIPGQVQTMEGYEVVTLRTTKLK